MNKNFFYFFFSLVFFCSFAAQAVQFPRYLGSERKFRSYIYNPNDVYRYIGHYTYQGFIEFESGESISTISMGNPSLWLFEHLGNRLFLKPVGEDNSETNMTVITNKRVYHFELMAKEAKGINDKDLIFVVKFAYPDEKDKNIVEFPRIGVSDEPDLRDLSIYNFNYQYTGEPTIAPVKVFDNGTFTYFQFPQKNADIPAIFLVDSQGFESLVNFRAAGSYIIVERVGAQFTLRNGSDIVCVYNNTLFSTGRSKATTEKKKSAKQTQPQMQQNYPGTITEVNAANSPLNINPAMSAPASMMQIPSPPSSMASPTMPPMPPMPPMQQSSTNQGKTGVKMPGQAY